MRAKIDLNRMCRTRVRIRLLDARGRCVRQILTKNSLTYAASDVLMTALLRSGPSQITHLYARFGTSGTPGNLIPSDLRTVVRGDFIAPTTGDNGGLWVPVLSAPAQDSSNSLLYSANQATMFFRIPYNLDVSQISPAGNFNASTSKFYALGLAVAKSSTDRTQDVIISALQDPGSFTNFPIPTSGQMAIDYVMNFTTS